LEGKRDGEYSRKERERERKREKGRKLFSRSDTSVNSYTILAARELD